MIFKVKFRLSFLFSVYFPPSLIDFEMHYFLSF